MLAYNPVERPDFIELSRGLPDLAELAKAISTPDNIVWLEYPKGF